MTFCDTNPPVETKKDEYPTLDTVVNVSNCFYYLSLLERFVQTTRSMPEDVLKKYLVRAEYRYFKWACTKKISSTSRYAIPPLDVAFFWQAHMLSPLRFYEDQHRCPQFTAFKNIKIPLKEIHVASHKVPNNVLILWKEAMGDEPYHLTEKHVSGPKSYTSYAEINCIVCYIKMEVDWDHYTEWRTDPTVALQCHRCNAMFTTKHVGKANMISDFAQKNAVAGLMYAADGSTRLSYKDVGSLGSVKDLKSLPFNSGTQPLSSLILKNQTKKLKNAVDNPARRQRIIEAIESTYLCNPYRGSSIDMIQAVARQYKFAFKATQTINWDAPQGIIKGIRQYSSFLQLLKTNPKLTAVPTFEIDLAWHTHMLFPNNYRKFTAKFVGKFLNHDDTIPETRLNQYIKDTDSAWKFRLDSRSLGDQAAAKNASDSLSLPKRTNSITAKLKTLLKKSESAIEPSLPSDMKEAFKGRYNPGTYQSPPAYKPTQDDTQSIKEGIDVYDVENISFHDKRDIKDFISFKNSDAVIKDKFRHVQRSSLGFIGTSTCGTSEYLNRWESPEMSEKEREALHSNYRTDGYSQVFISNGAVPDISEKKLAKLSLEQRLQQAINQTTPVKERSKRRDNPTTSDSFDWHKVSIVWAATYAGSGYMVGSMASCSGGVGSSCGAFSSCGGGAFSSCGGGSSSCGGGSSSCGGGGSSSCGGGGGGC
ncbi:hypothetical protein FB192DRAFT_1369666 [Mucor lusitanicus]|uniref:Uncharacterized protein n=1 Tax=Mucor circinelloides f. lusitanicus TaxID=29924 RepID=A0A8H4BK34_MUCCL|nr:hypothetical protein FB192DRAFT_1369666 [Mucor lusitanicus]